jgi:peroxygenase
MTVGRPLDNFMAIPSLMAAVNPKQSPYYVAPESMTPLQKHCAFFDRNGDGLIMPWESYAGFRVLGYNMLLSLVGTMLVHIFFSYWTLDTWIPDPFFAIVIKNVDRLKHGSDSEVYEHDGTLKPLSDPVFSLLGRFDAGQKGGMSAQDLVKMTQRNWDVMDFFGWWAAKIEWFFMWVLAQRDGVISFDDIRAQYDGTLFKNTERKRREAGLVM